MPGDAPATGGAKLNVFAGPVPRSRVALAVAMLTVVALILRLIGLNEQLWIDEISTVGLLRGSFADVVTTYQGSNNHPLYTLLSYLSMAAWGSEPWSIRLPAFIFGVATIPLLYAVGTRLTSRLEALLSCAFLAVSYHHIWFSQNARGYTALAFWTLLAVLLLLRALEQPRVSWWAAYGLVIGLGSYTHLTMVLVGLAHGAVMAALPLLRQPLAPAVRAHKRMLIGFGIGAALIVLLLSPVLGQVIRFFSTPQPGLAEKANYRWAIREVSRSLQLGFGGLAAVAAVMLSAAGGWSYLRRQPLVFTLIVAPAALTAGTIVALRLAARPRFFFFLIGFVMLFLARGIAVFSNWLAGLGSPQSIVSRRQSLVFAMSGLLIVTSAVSLAGGYRHPKQDFVGAMQFVESVRAPEEPVGAVMPASLAYGPYYRRAWPEVKTVADLDALRQGRHRVWLVYTLPEHVDATLLNVITHQCSTRGIFPGTLGGGDLVVCVVPPAGKNDLMPSGAMHASSASIGMQTPRGETETPLLPVLLQILGGPAEDTVRDVAVGADGSVYVTGGTASARFPVAKGSLDDKFGGHQDVYVARIAPDGQVAWSTLIGGPGYDRTYAIELDPQGFVVVAGRAGPDFPTTSGVLQPAFSGGPRGLYGPQDGFVCKITADGRQLVFCTYFGGPDESIIRDVSIDPKSSDLYVISARRSGELPAAIAGRMVNAPAGGEDVVLARIAADGSHVVWARYLGGSGQDGNQAVVRLDGAGDPYVLLTTTSKDIETTGDAYDRTLGGSTDVYLAKVAAADGSLVWATYLGGSDVESTETHELAVAADGTAVIATATHSRDVPTTDGAVQTQYGGGLNDVMVARLSADGQRLLASTFLGGRDNDRSEGVSVDAAGAVYLTGTTTSADFPVTSNAAQRQLAGERDAIVVKLTPNLDRLLYSSYLGGADEEFGRAASVTPDGLFALGGQTRSIGWPGATLLTGTRQGDLDGFFALFKLP